MAFSSTFIARYAYLWLLGLAMVCAVVLYVTLPREAAPEFDFGGVSSIVALRSLANGKFVEVSLEDGLLRATAEDASSARAQFRALVLGAGTVKALRIGSLKASHAAEKWNSNVKMVTKSGCRCSGFSNEHGFGRYCYPWETEWQAPWCYVSDTCAGSSVGSFSRRHEECPPAWADSVGSFNDSYTPPAVNGSQPWWGQQMYSGNISWREDGGAPVWRPPSSCPCSGVKSSLGFGAFCKGWEFAGQAPWCYVHDNCSLASASGNHGSFGHRFIECIYDSPGFMSDAIGRRLEQRRDETPQRIEGSDGRPRRLSAKASAPVSSVGAAGNRPAAVKRWGDADATHATDADESALLESVERLRQPHVALVSVATEGFVTVELPPHKYQLHAHARTDALSIRSVFSFLRSKSIMSLSLNALLNLCSAPTAAGSDSFSSLSFEAEHRFVEQSYICTGYQAIPGEPHRKLVRSPLPTSGFIIERLNKEALPKGGI